MSQISRPPLMGQKSVRK